MVCLFACFTSSKQRRPTLARNDAITSSEHIKLVELLQSDGDGESLSLDVESTKKQVTKEPINEINELKEEKIEKQLSLNEEKELNFDFDLIVKTNLEEKKESAIKEQEQMIAQNLVPPSTKHRYQNCESEDHEDDDKTLVQEESSDLFSLSIDSRKHGGGSELGDKEVTSSAPKCSFKDEVNMSDLNPLESSTPWKSVEENKENINVEQDLNIPVSPEPSFEFLTENSKPNADTKNPKTREIGVDTSLSSWLVDPETTKSDKSGDSAAKSRFRKVNSARSDKDRAVLGVITMEELNKLSASNSPRRSRNQTPAKTAAAGTVGNYWRHTGQATDSDSGSSCKGKPKIGSNKVEVID